MEFLLYAHEALCRAGQKGPEREGGAQGLRVSFCPEPLGIGCFGKFPSPVKYGGWGWDLVSLQLKHHVFHYRIDLRISFCPCRKLGWVIHRCPKFFGRTWRRQDVNTQTTSSSRISHLTWFWADKGICSLTHALLLQFFELSFQAWKSNIYKNLSFKAC